MWLKPGTAVEIIKRQEKRGSFNAEVNTEMSTCNDVNFQEDGSWSVFLGGRFWDFAELKAPKAVI